MAFRVVKVLCHQGWNTARACTCDSRAAIVPERVEPITALKLRVEPGVSPPRNPTAIDVLEPPNGAAPAAKYPVLPVDGADMLKPTWNAPEDCP